MLTVLTIESSIFLPRLTSSFPRRRGRPRASRGAGCRSHRLRRAADDQLRSFSAAIERTALYRARSWPPGALENGIAAPMPAERRQSRDWDTIVETDASKWIAHERALRLTSDA